jgi:hypothetical protein
MLFDFLPSVSFSSIVAYKEEVTVIGAVVAAFCSATNLWLSFRTQGDRIRVRYGALHPQISPGHCLYVLSESGHAMTVSDFGFVDVSGARLSLPDLWANEHGSDDGVCFSGSTVFEKKGDTYSIMYQELRDDQIAAYAKTAGMDQPQLSFRYGVPAWRRLWVKFRFRFIPRFQ